MNPYTALQINHAPRNRRNSEGTFVTLKNGRILFVWSKFNSDNDSDWGRAVLASRHSDDEGRTWSDKDEVVVSNGDATNVMSPSLLRLKDGRIALLYLRKDGRTSCVPWVRFSTNECRSFSKPVRVIHAPGYYVVNNDRMIQLRSGRLIAPVALHRYRGPHTLKPLKRIPGDKHSIYPKGLDPVFSMPGLIFFYFSDDGGQTWLESRMSYYHCTPSGDGLQEPGVVELKDGRLWSYARNGPLGPTGLEGYADRQWESFSKDQGQEWSDPKPSKFISPCSPMHVKRIPKTGHLLAVWNDHSKHFKVPKPKPISWVRTPLVSAISKDDGKTWRHHLLLESAPDYSFCYPAIHLTSDAALISYNFGSGLTRSERMLRIPFKQLYA